MAGPFRPVSSPLDRGFAKLRLSNFDLTGFRTRRGGSTRIQEEGIHSAIFDVQPIIGWKEVHEGKLSPVLSFGVVPYESKKAWIYDAHFGRIIDRDGKVKRVSEWIMADILDPVLQMISRSYGIETRPIR